jgi:uncharacterized protein (TIGR04255 family)
MGAPLKQPPVYLTLVQVRFNKLLGLASYMPAVQDNFRRAGYPVFEEKLGFAVKIDIQNGGPVPQVERQPQHFFGNLAQTHSFILTDDALSFQSTKYGNFEQFSNGFLEGLALVHRIVSLAYTERIGLRYLDHVRPLRQDNLSQYLQPEVQGIDSRLGGEALYSFFEGFNKVGDILLRSRVTIQNSELGFPADLNPTGVAVDERFRNGSGLHAMLDTDGYKEARLPFDLKDVGLQLKEIHKVISAAFKAVATPYAYEVWNS